ncbi:putative electron transport protein YkgF [Escherichia coli]|nr:putative electron transport protein YkgF [Escherichia coli]
MVTEEIGVNHVLQDAGIQVIETDLGEYILQLDQDPPSHVVVRQFIKIAIRSVECYTNVWAMRGRKRLKR